MERSASGAWPDSESNPSAVLLSVLWTPPKLLKLQKAETEQYGTDLWIIPLIIIKILIFPQRFQALDLTTLGLGCNNNIYLGRAVLANTSGSSFPPSPHPLLFFRS